MSPLLHPATLLAAVSAVPLGVAAAPSVASAAPDCLVPECLVVLERDADAVAPPSVEQLTVRGVAGARAVDVDARMTGPAVVSLELRRTVAGRVRERVARVLVVADAGDLRHRLTVPRLRRGTYALEAQAVGGASATATLRVRSSR